MPAQIIDLGNLPASDGFLIIGDANYDRAGTSVSAIGDINGDGIDDLIIGAPGNDANGDSSGAVYVVYGRTGGISGTLDLANLSAADGFVVRGVTGDELGRSVSYAGDINNDGIGDFVAGAIGSDLGGNLAGSAFVIFGQAGTSRGAITVSSLSGSDGFAIIGDADLDLLTAVSRAGDINNDGIDDLVVGASGNDAGGSSAGRAYVVFGRAGATRSNIDLASFAATDGFSITGDVADDRLGRAVSAAGDINGDGIDDVVVGAPYGDNGGSLAGEAYVIFGRAGATRTNIDVSALAATDGFIIEGSGVQIVGTSLASLGDINGDGLDDILVGAYRTGGGGAAYVIYGKVGATRGTINVSTLAASDGFAIFGDQAGDQFGISVQGGGDINGDGIRDLVIGANRAADLGPSTGEAYVIFGRAGTRSAIDVTNLAQSDGLAIRAASGGDQAGRDITFGDFNNDGIDDIIVSAIDGDAGGNNAGEITVIYGSRLFGAITGTAASETLNGTAANDALVGLDGNDVLNGGLGADLMRGGTGNDIYVVDNAGDTVEELAGEGGRDHVDTSRGSYTLPDNVENLEYTGSEIFSGTGNALGNEIVGGGQGDTLSGLDGDDTLGGEAGNDTLNGGDGSDRLIGGAGADTMNGGAGNDRMVVDNHGDVANGGDGIDTVEFSAVDLTYEITGDVEIVRNISGGDVFVTLNALANTYGGGIGIDRVRAGDGQDSLYGRGGDDTLQGEGGNDYLFGQEGVDGLSGGDGDDLLYGGADNDSIFAGTGNDTLYGEAGSDLLTGSTGIDQLFGGAGADLFEFFTGDSGTTLATADRIRDFSQAQGDRIQLDGIDAIAGGADNAFSFIGAGAFTGVAGQLRAEVVGGETRVSGDTNGDGVADFLIRIDGVHALAAGDFLL